jgi:hypothetical protein
MQAKDPQYGRRSLLNTLLVSAAERRSLERWKKVTAVVSISFFR